MRAISRRLDYVSDLTSRRANPANGVIADRCGAANRPTPRDNQADEINLECAPAVFKSGREPWGVSIRRDLGTSK